jgi:nanoRNase/pAp phosphatase (c-di-AMP/oligoRNAs hydrolase)
VSANLRRLFNLFKPNDKALIVIEADPDSIASAMALKRLLWRKVRSVTLAHFNDIRRIDNVTMVRLLKIPLVRLEEINLRDFSKTVLVDAQPYHHEILECFAYDVVIDHHPRIMPVKAPFVDIRPEYGATATIMTEYLRAAKIRPAKSLATALLYAIRVDTRNFEVSALEEDVKAFRFLFPNANVHVLRKIEIAKMDISDLHYFQLALENRRIIQRKIFSHLGRVHSPDVLVLVADFFMKCHEVAWTVISGICRETLIVVIRNDGLRKDAGVSAIKAFGRFGAAGGHRASARAEIPLTRLEAHFEDREDAHLGDFVTRQVKRKA